MSSRLHALAVGVLVLVVVSVAPSGSPLRPAAGWSAAGPAALPTDAQVSKVAIVGSVVDSALSPLAGVAVTLERGGRVEAKTATDAEGKYRFADIAPGDYRIRAEHTGFPTVSRDFTVPAGVATIQLPIVLTRAQDSKPTSTAQGASTFRSGIGAGVAAGGAAAAPPPAALLPPPSAQAAAGSGRGGGGGAMASPTQRDYVPQPNSWSGYTPYTPPASGESYAHIDANRFQNVRDNPLSTFGADVDTASYSNVRRFLSAGQLPPRDAVRIEELVNYFHFNYADPHDGRPIALTTEVGDCPWAPSHTLVLIGARAKASTPLDVEGRNIVLLIDVSGSMAPPERLPLIKTALGMFVDTLRPDDRLAIVTYAGTSGVALASTPVRSRDVIQRAIANLNAGGSTNGGEGLIMAYRVASENFIPGGINRVILFTDGDFNVGIVNQSDLVRLIEREKTTGVFLSVFGVGTGNLKDSMMEMLADKGNGHYAYLDSLQEARRVLVREADATLETVAKDVKFQVEFNPATVTAWKQIGYEDRALAARDFNNDRKDGGEMGAGHTVTVLYEVVPVGAAYSDGDDGGTGRPGVDPLKYQPQSQSQQATVRPDIIEGSHSGEWLTVKARYKMPEGDASELIMQAVRPGGRVQHLPLASAVAEFGLLLRDDRHDIERWDALARRVKQLHVPSSLGSDKDAFAELVEIARGLVRLR